MNFEATKARAAVLKAVAHSIRVMLSDAVCNGEKCVGDLCRAVDLD